MHNLKCKNINDMTTISVFDGIYISPSPILVRIMKKEIVEWYIECYNKLIDVPYLAQFKNKFLFVHCTNS